MKQRTSAQIKTELDRTNARLAELQPQLEDQQAKFETAEKSYISKRIDFEALQAEQSALTLIERAVNSLLATAGRLSDEYQDALKAEARVDAINSLKSAAEDAQAAFATYTERRSQLNDLIAQLEDARLAFRGKQAEFSRQFLTLVPGMDGFRFIPKTVRPLYDKTKAEIGVSDEAFSIATSLYPPTPELAHGAAVDAAERAIANTANQEADRQRSRQRDAAAARSEEMRRANDEAFRKEQGERAKKQQRWPAGVSSFRTN